MEEVGKFASARTERREGERLARISAVFPPGWSPHIVKHIPKPHIPVCQHGPPSGVSICQADMSLTFQLGGTDRGLPQYPLKRRRKKETMNEATKPVSGKRKQQFHLSLWLFHLALGHQARDRETTRPRSSLGGHVGGLEIILLLNLAPGLPFSEFCGLGQSQASAQLFPEAAG